MNYDGHTFTFGIDTDTEPSALPPSTAAKAVNRIFRGGRNHTRPPFVHLPYVFDSLTGADQFETLFRYGNYQGSFTYRKKKPGRNDGIVVSIAGHIFFCSLVNESFFIQFIIANNDPKLLHTWFCQIEEWLYIQNGKDRPIFWNGLFPSTARRSNPAEPEMPVGTLMAVAHGRIFLSNAFDQIAASDVIFSNGLTRSDAPQRFTENQYWAEGGYFGQPTELGEITGMAVMPRQDARINGQGELVILSEEGASSLEASIPRLQWKDSRIHTMTLQGRGCYAPASVVAVNNDLWFRSDDGLASYQMARAEQARQPSFGKLSQQINLWTDQDTPWLVRYASSLYFDNRVLLTVSPFLGQPASESYGSHRYHRGICALDLSQASKVQGDVPFNWDGLWTGIRPTGMVKMGKKAFIFSYDSDGQNRIYELRKTGRYDQIEGQPIRTKWFYVTKRFNFQGKSNEFELKKISGGKVWFSDVHERAAIGADYRADNCPCWSVLSSMQEFGSNFGDDWTFSLPRYDSHRFQTPDGRCIKGIDRPPNHGFEFQVMLYGEGHIKIDRLRIESQDNLPQTDDVCKKDNPKTVLDCRIEDDYVYDLADLLVNES